MQYMKEKGANLVTQVKGRLSRARSSSSGDALKLASGGGESRQAGAKAFYNCSPQEAHCRKLLVHQEALAGVVDRYMQAVLFALDDIALAHETLRAGLHQAADLVQPGWLEHVDALASSLRQGAEEGRAQLAAAATEVAHVRGRHREAVQLASEAQAAATRRQHYEEKVRRLREDLTKARESLGSAALDPDDRRGSGLLSKSLNQRKTNNYDLKQGQLCRNEEKLTRMVELHQNAHASSLRSLLFCVTFGRQKLQVMFEEILRCCMESLIPAIHSQREEAVRRAPPPGPPGAGSPSPGAGFPPRARRLEDAPPEAAELSVGDLVCVQGLASAAQYNGENGTVRNLRPDGRIEIELVLDHPDPSGSPSPGPQSGSLHSKVLAVRPENLQRLATAPLPTQCSGLLGQGAESLTLEDFDPSKTRPHEDSDESSAM